MVGRNKINLINNVIMSYTIVNEDGREEKPILHIEILFRKSSTCTHEEIVEEVKKLLHNDMLVTTETVIQDFTKPFLQQNITSIKICEVDSSLDIKHVDLSLVECCYHTYRLDCSGPGIEEMGGEAGEEEFPASSNWILPSSEFHGLWESLVYENDIKEQLLNFVSTTLLFSDQHVNSSIIAWNRVVLLHGPPGTGKTSLCKALAHKLSIRLAKRYKYGQLIEVNSHSLFSKWFSESGKLVQKMFTKITDQVEDPDSLVCVLIDEVESLTRARASTSSGSDPSDALRVVNALLTQLDQIKRYPNVLILTTSNLTGAIDIAFVDRADIKQYIGLPSPAAIYQIYHSCIAELMKTEIIAPQIKLFTFRELQITNFAENNATMYSMKLWEISQQSVGLSGRTLRKIPFLAHALFIHLPTTVLSKFLAAMEKSVKKQIQDMMELNALS